VFKPWALYGTVLSCELPGLIERDDCVPAPDSTRDPSIANVHRADIHKLDQWESDSNDYHRGGWSAYW
jgi:hypothetical protein